MYVTQDANKQLTVVNPAMALRVALQGISGIVIFLVRPKYETQRVTTTLLYGWPPFVTRIRFAFTHFRFISI